MEVHHGSLIKVSKAGFTSENDLVGKLSNKIYQQVPIFLPLIFSKSEKNTYFQEFFFRKCSYKNAA